MSPLGTAPRRVARVELAASRLFMATHRAEVTDLLLDLADPTTGRLAWQ